MCIVCATKKRHCFGWKRARTIITTADNNDDEIDCRLGEHAVSARIENESDGHGRLSFVSATTVGIISTKPKTAKNAARDGSVETTRGEAEKTRVGGERRREKDRAKEKKKTQCRVLDPFS